MTASARTSRASSAMEATSAISAHTAPQGQSGPLPVRSAADAEVKLARLSDLFTEAAGILRDLTEVPVDVPRETRLSVDVPKRLLSARDIAAKIGVNERTIRRWRRQGKMPAGVEFAGAIVRWRHEEIDAWIAGDEA